MNTYQPFEKACPVWAKGLEETINVTCGFYTPVRRKAGSRYLLKTAASSFYRVYVNGSFAYYGPNRCAHDFYRVDELDLTPYLKDGENALAIEVVSYNVNSFYALDQSGFLQAELFEDGSSIAFTAPDGGFRAVLLKQRRRRMTRYSFQRTIGESYVLKPGVDCWRMGDLSCEEGAELVRTVPKELVPRGIPLADFPKVSPVTVVSEGELETGVKRDSYTRTRWMLNISPKLKGFTEDEVEIPLPYELQELRSINVKPVGKPYEGTTSLAGKAFEIYHLGREKTGFLGMHITCKEAGSFYIMFDERLVDGDIDPFAMDCLNAIRFDVEPGEYDFLSFEPYGLVYLKLASISGSFEISDLHMLEYVCPEPIVASYQGNNPALKKIYDAAIETFRQNAADVFMDCPTRERAGWLCDSFFTGRVEKLLTGQNQVERAFLENFLLAKGFRNIPKGMLPMCYPADHYDGAFIPNWAMWFVIELSDYQRRSGDVEMAQKLRKKVYELVDYFVPFENELGLLEKLENWVFVEWSKANDLVQDVNYPSNMLYSLMLRTIGELYADAALAQKGERIAQTVRERSFDGRFFVDNEVRENGVLRLTGERTETCQYYAFFCDIATPDSYPELWQVMTQKFGPDRQEKGLYPEIYPSNAFIGNYLRLDILTRYGLKERCLKEIEGYFLGMAEQTGTLWEHMTTVASCNHGFASYVAYLIDKNS